MILASMMRFHLGQIVITTAALETVSANDICNAIDRHVCGNWGEMSADDCKENEVAICNGGRVVSAHRTANGTKFFVVTEADRASTTVLLKEEN